MDLIERENLALKAFTATMRATALAEAALADARRAAGDSSGILAGLPIAVKDIIDVAGIVSGCGSLTTRGAKPAERDAPATARYLAMAAAVSVLALAFEVILACLKYSVAAESSASMTSSPGL